jgi:hypothetical protein
MPTLMFLVAIQGNLAELGSVLVIHDLKFDA